MRKLAALVTGLAIATTTMNVSHASPESVSVAEIGPASEGMPASTTSGNPYAEQMNYLKRQCAKNRGSLCFWDSGWHQKATVSQNNTYWGSFGWNDRAVEFYNNGNKMNARIYMDANYQGDSLYLWRARSKRGNAGRIISWKQKVGIRLEREGFVSSNRWVH